MGAPGAMAMAAFVLLMTSGIVSFKMGDKEVSILFNITLRGDKKADDRIAHCRWGPCNDDDQCPDELPIGHGNHHGGNPGSSEALGLVEGAKKYWKSGCEHRFRTRALCCNATFADKKRLEFIHSSG